MSRRGCGWVCGQVLANMGKGGQVWMAKTNWMEMGDMPSGWVWVYMQV